MQSVLDLDRQLAAGQVPARATRSLTLLAAAHAVTHVQTVVYALITPVAARALGFGYADIGLMVGVGNLLFGMLQGLQGWLSRRVGPKALLGGGNLLIGVSLGLASLAGSFASFCAGRVVANVASSPQHPLASSMLPDLFPRERRGWAFAIHYAGGNVGTLLAPLLAGLLLAHTGWRQTLLLFTLPAFVAGAALWVWMDDPRQPRTTAAGERPRALIRVQALARRDVALILLSAVFTSGGQGLGVILTYVPLYLISDLHRSPATAGAYVMLLTAGSVVAPVLAGRLADRTGRRPVIVASFWLAALSVFWLVHAGAGVAGLVGALALLGCSVYNPSPLTQTLLADLVADEDRDGAFSVFYVTTYCCGAIWAFVIGLVVARWGFEAGFLIMAAAILSSSAVFLLVRERRPAAG